jgi:hypothetical protein
MSLSRACVAALSLLLLTLMGARGQAQACAVNRGERIMLASFSLDPDVFIWDSAQRLINYASGDFNTEGVLKHTLLARPGTKAVATECKDSLARPKFSTHAIDVIGVRIVSGPGRGKYGWVLAEDVRRMDGKPVLTAAP